MDISMDKLKKIENKTLSLVDICKALDIEYQAGGNARIALLNELSLYCFIENVGRKYVLSGIHSRYNSPIHQNNKFQIYLEQVILNMIKENNFNELYLSKTEILERFGLVNKNFKIVKNLDALRILGEEYFYLEAASDVVASIYHPWIIKRLDQMAKRSIAFYSTGIRLIKIKIKDRKEYYFKENLQENSQKEKIAMGCIQRARRESLPLGLQSIAWIPQEYYKRYETALRNELRQAFGPEYRMAYNILIIRSSKDSVELGLTICQEILNKESKRKIGSTKRLDFLTESQRNKFTKDIIELNPKIDYQTMIKNKKIKEVDT